MQAALRLDEIDIVRAERYATHGYPHEDWALLRREAPVHWFDRTEGEHFWAITKHADIDFIGKRPDLFISDPLLVVAATPLSERRDYPKNLIQFDPPKHGVQRKIVSHCFTPRALEARRAGIERLARKVVDDLSAQGVEGECDFVEDAAAPLAIAVLAWLLGVPEADGRKLLHWTHRIVSSRDLEYQNRSTAVETSSSARSELYEYFTHLMAVRRKEPEDDLVSLFVHAEVEGEPLSDREVLEWLFLMVAAGNETTRHAISGGLQALIEHEEALRRLQADPALITTAVEEVLRWTSPVVHFARTAAQDVELRGKTIREGQYLVLFYPSANRDEEVFEAPFEFRIDRQPNPHLAFGIGEHFCLGAYLARVEIQSMFRALLPRIEHVELTGEPERLFSSILGGVKHLPIRYRLKPASARG